MIHLFELQYHVQKGIYFTDKITTPCYDIYYSKNIPENYWNYAVISDLCSLKNVLKEVEQQFSSIGRPPNIYIYETRPQDLSELQKQRYRVDFTDSWLRYDNNTVKKSSVTAKRVLEKTDQENFVKLFSEFYCPPNPYFHKFYPEILLNLRASFENDNFAHFISYDGKIPVAAGTIGQYHNYCLLFNLSTHPDYINSDHRVAILNSCIEHYKQIGGLSLNLNLFTDYKLEKWYINNGFHKICSGCCMSC